MILTITMRSTASNTVRARVPVTPENNTGMFVPRYTQLNLDADTAKAMVQAADLGTNIQRLYQHELYFRTKGSKGERLNSVDPNVCTRTCRSGCGTIRNIVTKRARKMSWALKRSPSS